MGSNRERGCESKKDPFPTPQEGVCKARLQIPPYILDGRAKEGRDALIELLMSSKTQIPMADENGRFGTVRQTVADNMIGTNVEEMTEAEKFLQKEGLDSHMEAFNTLFTIESTQDIALLKTEEVSKILKPSEQAILEKALTFERIDNLTLPELRTGGQTTRLVGRWVNVEGRGFGKVKSFNKLFLSDSTHTVAFESGVDRLLRLCLMLLYS
jgi:hypothetical protein